MKKILYVCLFVAFLGPPAFAQQAGGVTGNLTASSTDCTTTNACLLLNVNPNSGGATIKLSGTFSATVQFEATADELTVLPSAASWVAINATPSNSTTAASSGTAPGVWQVNVAGYQRIRVRVSTYVSGTVAATINLSTASARGGSGAGAGGNISGTIAANQVAFGSGVNTIQGSAGLTYTAGQLDLNHTSTTSPQGLFSIRGAGLGNCDGLGSTCELFIADQSVADTGAIFVNKGGTATNVGSLDMDVTGQFNVGAYNATERVFSEYNTSGSYFLLTGNGALAETVNGSQNTTFTGSVTGNSFTSASDGVHAGYVNLLGNTTNQAVVTNTAGFMGPTLASFTAYALQLPSTGPANATPLLSCATPASSVSACTFVANGGGTVTSIATTAPIGGGTITTTGTITCTTCVVASSPGIGIAHFAGSTQTVTSSAVNLAGADVTGQLPIGAVGSSGLSGTAPVTISAAGAIACATCVTSAASLANGGLVIGTAGTQASATNTALTFSGSTLTVGLATSSTGILALTGATSGNATITAPATAGTRTNPVISSNYFQIGVAGTTSGELLLAGSASGTTTLVAPATAGTATNAALFSNSLQLPTGTVYSINGDTGLSRASAATWALGNGTAADTSGTLNLTTENLSNLGVANAVFGNAGHIMIAANAPTIAGAGCGGSGATIIVNNGSSAFKVGVGATPGSACTITLPAATTGWNCSASDITTQSTAVSMQRQTGAESTTSVIITNFSDLTVATAFVASDVLKVICFAD